MGRPRKTDEEKRNARNLRDRKCVDFYDRVCLYLMYSFSRAAQSRDPWRIHNPITMRPVHARALATRRTRTKGCRFETASPLVPLQEDLLNLPSGTIIPFSVHLRLQEVHIQAAKFTTDLTADGLHWLRESVVSGKTATLYHLWNMEVRGLLERSGGVAELRERARRWKAHREAGSAVLHSLEKAIEGWVIDASVWSKFLQWMTPIQLSTGHLRFLGMIAGSEVLRVRTTGQWTQCEKGLQEVVKADLEEVRMSHRTHMPCLTPTIPRHDGSLDCGVSPGTGKVYIAGRGDRGI